MRDALLAMRTTLDLDEDILDAAKELASQRGTTAGRVISELVRQALQTPAESLPIRNGVPLLARRSGGVRVTMKHVNELRDE
jgi:hypothetical protein